MTSQGKLYSVPEAAKKVGVTTGTLNRWLLSGKVLGIPLPKMPGQTRQYYRITQFTLDNLSERVVQRGQRKTKNTPYILREKGDIH
jgi:transposase